MSSVSYIVEWRGGRILREVDGLEVDEVEVAAQAGVGAVRLAALGVRERDRVDVVVAGVVDEDAEAGLAAEGGVDGELAARHETLNSPPGHLGVDADGDVGRVVGVEAADLLEGLGEAGVEVRAHVGGPAGAEGEGAPARGRGRRVEEAECRARPGQEDRGEADAVLLGVGQDPVLVRQAQGSGKGCRVVEVMFIKGD